MHLQLKRDISLRSHFFTTDEKFTTHQQPNIPLAQGHPIRNPLWFIYAIKLEKYSVNITLLSRFSEV